MGRVDPSRQERRTRPAVHGLGRRQRRSDNFLTPQFSCASVKSGLNFARYCDPGLDKLIADGKAASSQEQRTGLYHQAQKLIHEQALWLPLAHPTAFALTRQEVQGYQVNPFGRQDFSRVAVKR